MNIAGELEEEDEEPEWQKAGEHCPLSISAYIKLSVKPSQQEDAAPYCEPLLTL